MRARGVNGKQVSLLGCALSQSFVAVTLGVSSSYLILITHYHPKACRYLRVKIWVAEVMIYGEDFTQWTETA